MAEMNHSDLFLKLSEKIDESGQLLQTRLDTLNETQTQTRIAVGRLQDNYSHVNTLLTKYGEQIEELEKDGRKRRRVQLKILNRLGEHDVESLSWRKVWTDFRILLFKGVLPAVIALGAAATAVGVFWDRITRFFH